jgi:hypothetical protein
MEARVAELDEELRNLSLGRVKGLSLASSIKEWSGSKTGKHSQRNLEPDLSIWT